MGEAVRLYRDSHDRLVKVCDLCRERARALGFQGIGFDGGRLRVHASGSLRDVAERDELIEGLGAELAFLKQQLGEAETALIEQSLQEESLRAITDKLRRQERELERLRREADPEQRDLERRTIKDQHAELVRLREQLAKREEQVARLQAARRAETDSNLMCGHALDAFNSSEHADRMSRIARTLGDPEVSVNDMGAALPRRVHITLTWDIAWYEFCVKLDLGAGKASVQQIGTGGDPTDLDRSHKLANAHWRPSGLVLATAPPVLAEA